MKKSKVISILLVILLLVATVTGCDTGEGGSSSHSITATISHSSIAIDDTATVSVVDEDKKTVEQFSLVAEHGNTYVTIEGNTVKGVALTELETITVTATILNKQYVTTVNIAVVDKEEHYITASLSSPSIRVEDSATVSVLYMGTTSVTDYNIVAEHGGQYVSINQSTVVGVSVTANEKLTVTATVGTNTLTCYCNVQVTARPASTEPPVINNEALSSYTVIELIEDIVGKSASTGGGGIGTQPTNIYNTHPNTSTATYANVPALYVSASPKDGDLFVSPTVTTAGQGSIDNPTTLADAVSRVVPGTTVFVMGGTYSLTDTLVLSASGTLTNYITLTAYNNEEVILDFSAQAEDPSNRGILLSGDRWHIYGLTVKEAGDNGMMVGGDWNIIENCVFHSNHDTGLQISRTASSLSSFADWPHDNLIKYCTSYDNADSDGEDADGFAAKLTCGNDNTFDHCISYCNIDDGWDLFTKTETGPIGRVIIVNCIAFSNGKLLDGTVNDNGDRNGFKLGGADVSANHYIYNCMAFNNGCHGFTENSNTGDLVMYNCTSFNNGLSVSKSNFMLGDNACNHDMKNLLSVCTGTTGSDKYTGSVNHCLLFNSRNYYYIEDLQNVDDVDKSGTKMTNYTTSNYSSMFMSVTFTSTNANAHTQLRNEDGTINLGNFLKLKSDSAWYTMGEDGTPLGADLSRSSYSTTVAPSLTSYTEVIDRIDNLATATPIFSSNGLALIKSAGAGYLSLTPEDRQFVTNIQLLVDAIVNYDVAFVGSLSTLINAIPQEVTTQDLVGINEAITMYASATVIHRALLNTSLVTALTEAENDYNLLLPIKAVEDLISALNATFTMSATQSLTEAKDAYNALSTGDKALVSTVLVNKLNSLIAQHQEALAGSVHLDLTDTVAGGMDKNGFFFIGSGCEVDSGKADIAGVEYNNYIDLKGALNSTNNRYITFTTTSSSSLTIAGYVGSTGRTIVVRNADNVEVFRHTFTEKTQMISVDNLPAGTYTIYSAGSGIRVYDLIVNQEQ